MKNKFRILTRSPSFRFALSVILVFIITFISGVPPWTSRWWVIVGCLTALSHLGNPWKTNNRPDGV